MEPQIRYVRSADGTRIAVSTIGQGPPIVYPGSGWLDSVQMYWQIPETRTNLEHLAERYQLVVFDIRGSGLSERDVSDFSLGARLHDLGAVVDSLGEPAAGLVGNVYAAPLTISYAAQNPDKVRALVLYNGLARGRDVIRTPRTRALRRLIEADWDLYVQSWVLVYFGWTELGRRVASTIMGSLTPESFLARLRVLHEDDASADLPQVRCPTLLMLQRNGQIVSLETSRQMAAAIPNARLALVDQENPLAWADEQEMRIIADFLDEAGRSRSVRPQLLEGSGTAIILFADIADSTSLTERLGDGAFREKARELDGTLREAMRKYAGIPIEGKLLGDGVLAVFPSAREAIEAAVCCTCAGASAGMPVHLGLHAGDVIREEGNIYGGAVNIASRISGLATPGEVLVSDIVRGLARTSAGVRFKDRGEQTLKGIGEPMRVWSVAKEEATE
jgi:class 3 adenylate cyclase